MTISSIINDISPIKRYTVGVSPQSSFEIPFRFFENSDIIVWNEATVDALVGATPKVLDVDYTLTGSGLPNGGQVNFVVPVTSSVVVILRQTQLDKEGEFPLVGAFDVCVLNTELSRLVAMIQDNRFLIETKFGYDEPDTILGVDVSNATARANGFLGFDGSGNFGVFANVTTGAATISAYILTLLDDPDAATARTTLGLGNAAIQTVGITNLQNLPNIEDIQQQGGVYAVDTGSADAYAISLSIAPSAYADGQRFAFKASFENAGSATLNVNTIGAKTLKKATTSGIVNLAAGDH